MKKIVYLLLGFSGFLMSSCKFQPSITPFSTTPALDVASVPASVKSSLLTSFPTAANTVWTKVSPDAIQAAFTANSTAKLATFNTLGQLMYAHDVIAPGALPAAVTNYLTANYAGYVIVKAGNKTDKNTGAVTGYVVEFALNGLVYEARFDAAGTFLSLEMEDGHDEGSQLQQSALPAATLTYLDANYKGYTFLKARSDRRNGVVTDYEVDIRFNGMKYELQFNAAGTFLGVENDSDHDDNKGSGVSTLQTALPAAVSNYLTANYAGYTFVKAKTYFINTVASSYKVKITLNGMKSELIFDANGNFLSMKAEKSDNDDHDKKGDNDKNDGNETDTPILQSALPATITTYLDTNFKGYAFVSAFTEMKGTAVTEYKVNITLIGKAYRLDFNPNGTFKKD